MIVTPLSVITAPMRCALRRVGAFGTLLVVGCSNARDAAPTSDLAAATVPVDAGIPNDAAITDAIASDAGVDASNPALCVEGRRRCVGLDLEICDEGAWMLLESCLPSESCDVAVGICRAIDAGTDAE